MHVAARLTLSLAVATATVSGAAVPSHAEDGCYTVIVTPPGEPPRSVRVCVPPETP